MQIQKILTTAGLLLILGASCTAQGTAGPTSGNGTSASDGQTVCNVSASQPKPLSTALIPFNQFNFQPMTLDVKGDTVTVETPYHTFSLCDGAWSIASKAEATDANDGRGFLETQNRDYKPIEINGQTYEYRVRLKADWLDNQSNSAPADSVDSDSVDSGSVDSGSVDSGSENSAPPSSADANSQNSEESTDEDAVYFDFKKPDGSLITRQLYSLSDLQKAGLGSSLSIPRVSDTATTANPTAAEVWFSIAADRGEGANGFADLIHYNSQTGDLNVYQPEEIQGSQITSIAIAPPPSSNRTTSQPSAQPSATTIWLGTKSSGEGNPNLPAQGLVAYQPATKQLKSYTVSNSPLVGAIPFQLATTPESLWVATGNGVCQVPWQTAEATDRWTCWRFTATAELPAAGVDLYPSFLADSPANKLQKDNVEVLWANRPLGESPAADSTEPNPVEPASPAATGLRYEVVYEQGFEVQLASGGSRLVNPVSQTAAQGDVLFWPGRDWHWNGERFVRSLDEVSINLFGGGPAGLVVSEKVSDSLNRDVNAIRGDFDLLDITGDSTKVRYYSGWVNSSDLTVYPAVVPATVPKSKQPNPLDALIDKLPAQGP